MQLATDLRYNHIINHTSIIYGDNKASLALSEQARITSSNGSKPIDIKLHWIREVIYDGELKCRFVKGTENVEDGLTKGRNKEKKR